MTVDKPTPAPPAAKKEDEKPKTDKPKTEKVEKVEVKKPLMKEAEFKGHFVTTTDKGYDGDWSWESMAKDAGHSKKESVIFGNLVKGVYKNDKRTWVQYTWKDESEAIWKIFTFSIELAKVRG